ncbi:hypothetical protein CDL15_Pgr026962 [Punica granatum]|uniref:Disease resistance R13L4/SHOC-2-like LRR domain-containing protein n=1 Tax=Punica granatum TaxID=22663 RepID=A0A218XZM2_PUNGR|nr:hypothetical protein CDL15_Pgr026962 [Punica granatum]
MAPSSSSSRILYHADRTIFIQPIVDNLSILRKQLSEIDVSRVDDRDHRRSNQLHKVCRDLKYIGSVFEKLDSFGSHVGDMLSQLEKCVRDLLPATSSSAHNYAMKQVNDTSYVHNAKFKQNLDDGDSSPYAELVAQLEHPLKQLLLYFTAFPHDSVIKKRVLKNWWIADAEALSELPVDEAENKADRALEELVLRGLIKTERKQRRLVGYRMPHPLIHLSVVELAKKEKFFAFDSNGNPTVELKLQRGCLVKARGGSSLNILYDNYQSPDLELLLLVFNINEPYPDFRPQQFSKAKGIGVLSLGKWQSSHDCHIEVESTEFLKATKSLKNLRFFSLRGVSRVFELPDALCKLISLTILDINACHNLDMLPEEIGSLKSLVYLDISECYLLETMPKGLASLTELRVLKGFLIIDTAYGLSSCDFKDLAGLKKLNKLSVSANSSHFPGEDDLNTFRKFPLLQKLTISWRGKSTSRKPEGQAVQANSMSDPESRIQSQEAKSSSNPNSELQSEDASTLSNTGGAASGYLENRAAERRNIGDNDPVDNKDIHKETISAAGPKPKGVRHQDTTADVAEKETDPRRTEGTGNTGEIVAETEPAAEGSGAIPV